MSDQSSASTPAKAAVVGPTESPTSVKPQPHELADKESAVLWAKMPGFQPWPARFCSAFEESQLRKIKDNSGTNQAVIFFGKLEKGWVQPVSVYQFNKANWAEKVVRRRIKDKEYRTAVQEAVFLVASRGEDLGEEAKAVLQDYDLSKKKRCQQCMGTEISGSLLPCAYCEDTFQHLHCFRWSDANVNDKGFVCDVCCRNRGLEVGTIIEYASESESSASEAKAGKSTPKPSSMKAEATSSSTPGTSGGDKPKDGKPGNANKEAPVLTEAEKQERAKQARVEKERKGPTEDREKRDAKRTRDGNRTAQQESETSATSLRASTQRRRSEETEAAGSGSNRAEATTSGGSGQRSSFSLKEVVQEVYRETNGHSAHPLPIIGEANDDVCYEDNCQICGQEGELLLCDYPSCNKVYHRICLAKVLPFSMLSPEPIFESVSSNTTWFCPRHHCTGCGALEQLPPKATISQLPSALCAFAQRGGFADERKWAADSVLHRIPQKALCQCASCAFSICSACQTTLSPTGGLLTTNRVSGAVECWNCFQPTAAQRFARLLEQAFMKMANSRLALPFLRPFLPLYMPSHAPLALPAFHAAQSSRGVADLLAIQERIHSCAYTTVEDMVRDVESLRGCLEETLRLYLEPSLEQDSSDLFALPEYKDMVLAYYTLVDQLHHTLNRYHFAQQLAQACKALEDEESRANSTTRTQDNSQGSDALFGGTGNSKPSGSRPAKRLRLGDPVLQENEDRVQALLAQAPEDATEGGSASVQVMRKLWRVECHRHPWSASDSLATWCARRATDQHNVDSKDRLTESREGREEGDKIPPRSLSSWLQYIRFGMHSSQRVADETSSSTILRNAVSSLAADLRAKEVVHDFLMSNDDDVDDDFDAIDGEGGGGNPSAGGGRGNSSSSSSKKTGYWNDNALAAKMLTGMQFSSLRESTSLPAHPVTAAFDPSLPRHSVTDLSEGLLRRDGSTVQAICGSSPREDEALLMMQRLEEMTQHALLLQAKLRSDYLQRQRKLCLTSSEVLTVGEASLAAELKLANDLLRAQLCQRDKLLHEQKLEIQWLRKQLSEQKARGEEASSMLAMDTTT